MTKLQYFIENLFLLLFSLIKIILKSKIFICRYKPQISINEELIILGNGPSLRTSFKEHENYFKNKTLMCVNGFALSEYYKIYKPKYYTLSAPEFWLEIPPTEAHIAWRKNLFDIIEKETDWELHIFIPVAASHSKFWKSQFKTNTNIHIHYFNATPVEGFKCFTHFAYKYNLGIMRPHNVLVPSIYLGLNLNYKKIIIFGADHSWHEELKVNENNQVTVNHEHFYDKGKVVGSMHKLGAVEFKIHDMFRKWYLAFKSYFLLLDYSKSKNAEILNASSKSYIDAFKKIKID